MLRRRLNGVRNRTCGLEGKTTAMQSPPVCRRNYQGREAREREGARGLWGTLGQGLADHSEDYGFYSRCEGMPLRV